MNTTSSVNISILESDVPEVTGIFDSTVRKSLFSRYRIEITFLNRVFGGVPQRKEIIESWLRQRVAGGDEELKAMMLRTLDEIGANVDEGATVDELWAASNKAASDNYANTFRRDSKGIYLGDYQVKAAMKESVAILYPYQNKNYRMGATSKAARAFWAERVFLDEPRIHFNRMEPDGNHLHIGHVVGPKGPRSTLSYFAYCETKDDDHLKASFTVSSAEDCIKQDMWERVLVHMESNGLGAIRSMGYGQFRVTGFEQIK